MVEDRLHPDALTSGPVRGRGAQLNPANRFESHRLHVLGEHLDAITVETDTPDGKTRVATQVYLDRTRTILNRVDPNASPDIPFRWSVNTYRGCEHGCVYCYARPDHERLGFSCGLDFETKIVAKPEAPALLRRELASPRWRPETIAMAGVTDVYQPVEAKLKITRGCLEVMAECRQPVAIVTKSRLVLRDLDLLQELARHDAVRVAVSVTTLDRDLAMKMEPRASAPADRLHTIRALTDVGVPTVAMVAPIIPGLTDKETPRILEAVADAGACGAACILLRLPYQIKALFLDWLARHFPDRAGRVESLIRQTRQGRLYDATPFARQRGRGPVAEQINRVFSVFKRRYGLDRNLPPLSAAAFRRPTDPNDKQMPLFA